VFLYPDKDFINTNELKEYEKIKILDIANNNYVTNYINNRGKEV